MVVLFGRSLGDSRAHNRAGAGSLLPACCLLPRPDLPIMGFCTSGGSNGDEGERSWLFRPEAHKTADEPLWPAR
jgi:hypothetical protein